VGSQSWPRGDEILGPRLGTLQVTVVVLSSSGARDGTEPHFDIHDFMFVPCSRRAERALINPIINTASLRAIRPLVVTTAKTASWASGPVRLPILGRPSNISVGWLGCKSTLYRKVINLSWTTTASAHATLAAPNHHHHPPVILLVLQSDSHRQ
jgi:hypothetical protein